MGSMFTHPITKNYTFPAQFNQMKPIEIVKQQTLLTKNINPNNTIPPVARCQTINFVSRQKEIQPKVYTIKGPKKFKILTYNIWFEENNAKNRYLTLLKLIQESDADFICIQQATKSFLSVLQKSQHFKKYYYGRYKMHWYDIIILSKYHCVNYKIPFSQSFMQRSLLVSQLLFVQKDKNGALLQTPSSILIANCHLQSLDNAQLRIKQLKQTFYYLSWTKWAVLVGDFNFSDTAKQNQFVPKEYRDLYLQKHKKADKTMYKTPKYGSWRPDHIIVKGGNIKESNTAILGDFSVIPYEHEKPYEIQKDGIVRTPSDHLGIIAELHFQ